MGQKLTTLKIASHDVDSQSKEIDLLVDDELGFLKENFHGFWGSHSMQRICERCLSDQSTEDV